MEECLRRFTLHDSHWLSLNINSGWGDSAVAVILLDSVWNPAVSNVPIQGANEPLLFIRFESVSSIRLSGFHQVGNVQRGISEVTVTVLSEEEVSTTISDHYGATILLQHFSLINILVMSSNGELLIPSLSRSSAIT